MSCGAELDVLDAGLGGCGGLLGRVRVQDSIIITLPGARYGCVLGLLAMMSMFESSRGSSLADLSTRQGNNRVISDKMQSRRNAIMRKRAVSRPFMWVRPIFLRSEFENDEESQSEIGQTRGNVRGGIT